MATREENLKKINDELEKLNDDELEKVAGGTLDQTADDSRFLNGLLAGPYASKKYHQCNRYGAFRLFLEPTLAGDVEAAWKSLGIDVQFSSLTDLSARNAPNKYFLNGKEISQSAAYQYAKDLVRGPQGW